jgi:hypothetical protein
LSSLLFQRILPEPAGAVKPAERRSTQRYVPAPEFPLTAVLSLIGRDENGELLSSSRQGWHWKGHLMDISLSGARLRLGAEVRAKTGDACDLWLSVGDFKLTVPCHIVHLREGADGLVCGLKHDIDGGIAWAAYRQLVEVIALGYTLRPQDKVPKADQPGYLVERFISARPARLTLWRKVEGKALSAFEFLMKGSIVRAVAGGQPEYFSYVNTAAVRPASSNRAREIHRLFGWVVPNLAPVVPDDVRNFLRTYV